MSFFERMKPALAFESAVIERLHAMGWMAFPFGQTQLPNECRDRLKRFVDTARRPSLIRWMPDIITFRDYPNNRSSVALIDAKVCEGRPNYSLEISAIETAEIYTDWLFTPTFFVFDDWRALTPRDARQRGIPGNQDNNGSGTPYVLVSKRFSVPMETYFPPDLKKTSGMYAA